MSEEKLFNQEYQNFCVGDIVQEKWVFTYHEEKRMTGVIAASVEKFYEFFYPSDPLYVVQDKIRVFWFSHGFVEELPGDMVNLLSRAEHKDEKVQSR